MALSFLGKGGKTGANSGGPSGPRFAMLAEVRAYWEGLRVGGSLPARDRIDPRGIAGALENTFLLERIAPGIARFRIAGMMVHDVMGMDVRGMPLSALYEPQGRNRLSDALEGVFAGPATLELWLEAERSIGRPPLEGRMLLLPLTSAAGKTELALGCLALDGVVGRAPRRFAISGLMSEVIERRNQPDRRDGLREASDRRLPDLPPVGRPGFAAPPQAAFTPAPPSPLSSSPSALNRPPRADKGKPYLRLVHSRD
ncbi:PAS domain-containing protein [Rhodobacter sp. KR11]|uniref:PAS domain-containing protein n=1 Tax=Rhodobacter sp. KR11 TaxID=2974588 RepID=UPI00222366E8|nr:PAS domain-containing protein [Rhodobacter sp. KR11]MCW1917640.1 PAS domain-containing protein [Rhodobacter sp. KR11]